MMLRLNVDNLQTMIETFDGFRTAGALRSADGMVTAKLSVRIGQLCEITAPGERAVTGEVVAIQHGLARILPFGHLEGFSHDGRVIALNRKQAVPSGMGLMGRVINGLGEPIDHKGPLHRCQPRPLKRDSTSAVDRPKIVRPFVTGQRVIDGLLTFGQGQRIGLFAGSGVGKSTLLAEIAKGAEADANVIALIGERAREVRPFLEDCLGPSGLSRSVVVVACSDETPLMRVRAAEVAVAIACDLRAGGKHVLFLMDSMTRLAMAQREIGLLLDEPPSSRGYTHSVFQLLSRLAEQLGTSASGSITGVLTILVDGDDLDEPVSDAARGILDGHIILDRNLAEKGHFPPVSVSQSISRVFQDVTDNKQQQAARAFRELLATHAEFTDLIRIGAYNRGNSAELDRALDLLPQAYTFLRQKTSEHSDFGQTCDILARIAQQWESPPDLPA